MTSSSSTSLEASDRLSEESGRPMDAEEQGEVAGHVGIRDEDAPDTLENDEDDEVNLKKMADDYAKYLIVNSKQDQTTLDDKIDGVYTRVDEFKQQLYFLHQNITSDSSKMQELQENSEQLEALFNRIDQMEAFLGIVSRNVDLMEGAVSQAEKDLEPSKIRKVFSSLPSFGRKTAPKSDPTANWSPPKVFRSKDYFSHDSPSSPTSSLVSSTASASASPLASQSDEQLPTPQVTGQQKVSLLS